MKPSPAVGSDVESESRLGIVMSKGWFCLANVALTLNIFGLLHVAVAADTNVIFILTDDQGHWAINANGQDDCRGLHTPNLARLTREGTRFSASFVATPVCSPSRATWLTGRLPSQHGVQDWLLAGRDIRKRTQIIHRGPADALAGHWRARDTR